MTAILTIIGITITTIVIIKVRHLSDQAPGCPTLNPESFTLADKKERVALKCNRPRGVPVCAPKHKIFLRGRSPCHMPGVPASPWATR